MRVLIIEDSADDVELLVLEIQKAGIQPFVRRVETVEQMHLALDEEPWDVILSDYVLPHFGVSAALTLLWARSLDIPFIVVSGKMGEETAVEVMRAGAHDYLMKDNLTRLVPAIQQEIQAATNRRMRQRFEQQKIDLERATIRMEELQKLNHLKDEFISMISHELRTPMSNMQLAIRLLETDISPDKQAIYLQILSAECTREIALINNLLDIQTIELGMQPVIGETLDLVEWLPTILDPITIQAAERQQQLSIQIAPDLIYFFGQRSSLERIVTELVSNACKYTPGGGQIEVCLEAICGGSSIAPHAPTAEPSERLRLTVSNTGPGIAPENLSRIFEKFFRIPNDQPWGQVGTGLGLALVDKLVARLEGTIAVESRPGWTTFTVELPPLESIE